MVASGVEVTLSAVSEGTQLMFTDAETGALLSTAFASWSEIRAADIVTDDSLF